MARRMSPEQVALARLKLAQQLTKILARKRMPQLGLTATMAAAHLKHGRWDALVRGLHQPVAKVLDGVAMDANSIIIDGNLHLKALKAIGNYAARTLDEKLLDVLLGGCGERTTPGEGTMNDYAIMACLHLVKVVDRLGQPEIDVLYEMAIHGSRPDMLEALELRGVAPSRVCEAKLVSAKPIRGSHITLAAHSPIWEALRTRDALGRLAEDVGSRNGERLGL